MNLTIFLAVWSGCFGTALYAGYLANDAAPVWVGALSGVLIALSALLIASVA